MRHSIHKLLALSLLVTVFAFATVPLYAQGTDSLPQITAFTTSATQVDSKALADKTARIPVSWTTINRPVYANLVFEQVLPNGEVINVELPRSNPWVNSSGDGVAAPVAPGDAATILLQVRLVNMFTRHVYDQRQLTLPIRSTNNRFPSIRFFTTTATSVSLTELQNHTARIPVSWAVDNRDNTMNLVFEQVFSETNVINVELPRDDPWVASSGNGVVAPYPPIDPNAAEIVLWVRLVNTRQQLLDKEEIHLPITGMTGETRITVVPVSECYSDPFYHDRGIHSNAQAHLIPNFIPASLPIQADRGLLAPTVGELRAGDEFTISEGPYCFYRNVPVSDEVVTYRQWHIRSKEKNIDGWINEYDDTGTDTNTDYIQMVDANVPRVVTFTVEPQTVRPGDTITVTWQVSAVEGVELAWFHNNSPGHIMNPVDPNRPVLPAAGSYTLITPAGDPTLDFTLTPYGKDDLSRTITITVNCEYAWFVQDAFYTGERCPGSSGQGIQAAYQPFERGFMVWYSNRIGVFSLSNSRGILYQDAWNGSPLADDGRIPPGGFYKPVNGFGYLWTTNESVRNLLGWATAPEQSYTAQIQDVQAHTTWNYTWGYLQLPGGRVLQIHEPSYNTATGQGSFSWRQVSN